MAFGADIPPLAKMRGVNFLPIKRISLKINNLTMVRTP